MATEPCCFIWEVIVNRRLNRFFIFPLFFTNVSYKTVTHLLGGYFSAFNQTTAKTVKWNLDTQRHVIFYIMTHTQDLTLKYFKTIENLKE